MLAFNIDDVLNQSQIYFGDNETIMGIIAKLKYYAAEFAMTDQQLRNARSQMNDLRNAASSTGSVKTSSGKVLSISDIDAMIAENTDLQNQRMSLENQLMDFISSIQSTMSAVSEAGEEGSAGTAIGEEGFPSFPGMMGLSKGLGIAPLAIAAIIASGGLLVYSISRFIDAVKGNVQKPAGVLPFLFGDSLYWILGGIAFYFLFFQGSGSERKLKKALE